MASSDHLKLSTFVKSVHSNLRKSSITLGSYEAWNNHCKNEEILKEYSEAMKILASNHWQNNFANNSKAVSRIDWVHKYCQQYFFGNLSRIQREKERNELKKLNINSDINEEITKNLKLLDVGSCYNPFKKYSIYDITAIDIAPASEDVQKCDFLNVTISNEINLKENKLPKQGYHIVVFSLFLEYLPSPEFRLKCCTTAYNLLKAEGLLFIITPDSKHVGANAAFMKSWRVILARIGFSRIKYEKLSHIHCMVFRKNNFKEVSERWALLNQKFTCYEELFIPQDFKVEEPTESKSEHFVKFDELLLDELPLDF